MDPNATLKELRQLVEDESLDGEWSAESAAQRLSEFAELVSALDGWLSQGGFLPAAWRRTAAGDCPRCNSHDDDLSARGGICESCYQEDRS